jgi:soluble lytic murein transglycosylase-like protein
MPTKLPEGYRHEMLDSVNEDGIWSVVYAPRPPGWLEEEDPIAAEVYAVKRKTARTWVVKHSKSYPEHGGKGFGAFAYERLLEWLSKRGSYLTSDQQVSNDAVHVWNKYKERADRGELKAVPLPAARQVRRYDPKTMETYEVREEPSVYHKYKLPVTPKRKQQASLDVEAAGVKWPASLALMTGLGVGGLMTSTPARSTSTYNVSQPAAMPSTSPAATPSTTPGALPTTPAARALEARAARYRAEVEQVAERTGLDPALLDAMIRTESGYKPEAASSKGARGLMQLTPVTMREMKLPEDASHSQMLHGGAKYMARLLKRYNDDLDLALAAYNAGPGNVAKYNGVPPFKETQNYIAKVKAAMASSKLTKKSSFERQATQTMTLYHGSNSQDIRQLNLSPAGGRGYFGTGAYLTPEFDQAAFYGKYVYEFTFNGSIFADIEPDEEHGKIGDLGDVWSFYFMLGDTRYQSWSLHDDADERDVAFVVGLERKYGADTLYNIAGRGSPRLDDIEYGLKELSAPNVDFGDLNPAVVKSIAADFATYTNANVASTNQVYEIDHTDIGQEVKAAGYDAVLIPGLEVNYSHTEVVVFDVSNLTLQRVWNDDETLLYVVPQEPRTARLRLTAAGNVDLRGIDLWLGAHVARAMMNPEGLSAGLNKVFGPADATVFGKPAHTMHVQDIADGQLKLTEPILRTPQADAWLRNTRIAIVDGEHVNGDRGGYSPERNVLVIYPRAYQNIDGVTATITHELRHAADAGYNPLNIQKQVDAMQQLSNRKDLSKTEQNRRYMQLDTELKSFVGNMARRLVNDLGPHALEMLNVPDVWPPEAKQIYDLVDGRNRPKFMTRVYKEVQSLLAAEGLV